MLKNPLGVDRIVVFLSIIIYLIAAVYWEFASDAPWDDDCVTRYFNTKDAFNNPKFFVSLWNRPLFTFLFAIPFQISRHAILLMSIISAFAAYLLYVFVKRKGIASAYLVVPLLLFQSFYFVISKSSLAEPLAAAVLIIGLYLHQSKKFFLFALVGSLLPLARLELSPVLILWAWMLYKERLWQYIPILGLGVFIWSLTGTIIEGDTLWLLNEVRSKDTGSNRYGHTSFGHYFHRYIYVTGPVVFYFLCIGLVERIIKWKQDWLILAHFIPVFTIYVLFSWKLNLGQAAGFLRHMIVIAPFAAILALEGFNFWMQSIFPAWLKVSKKAIQKPSAKISKELLEKKIFEIQKQAEQEGWKARKLRHTIAIVKKSIDPNS